MKVLSGLDLSNNSIRNANIDNVKISGESDNLIKIGEHGELVDSGISADSIDLSSYYTKTEVDAALDDKQDVINDLAEIRSGAALGATALQEHQDISGKQDVLVSGTNIKTINNQSLLGEGNITIEGGGAAVQSDWEQDDSSADDFIKNKPDLSVYATEDSLNESISYVLENGGYVKSEDLALVATSGDYSDLENTPDLSVYAESSNLASVATSGDYGDLENTPDLSVYAESSDLASVATSGDYGDLNNTPDLSVYAESSNLASVATSGDYGDLSNTPDLSDYVVYTDLSDAAFSGSYNDLINTPDLSEYVTSENLGTSIENFLYDNLATLIEDSGVINDRPIKNYFMISSSDTAGQYTYTLTLNDHTDMYPLVQIVYDSHVITHDVTITFGFDSNEGCTTLTVAWDNTKYPVNDEAPLVVSYAIL